MSVAHTCTHTKKRFVWINTASVKWLSMARSLKYFKKWTCLKNNLLNLSLHFHTQKMCCYISFLDNVNCITAKVLQTFDCLSRYYYYLLQHMYIPMGAACPLPNAVLPRITERYLDNVTLNLTTQVFQLAMYPSI